VRWIVGFIGWLVGRTYECNRSRLWGSTAGWSGGQRGTNMGVGSGEGQPLGVGVALAAD
jgi:hypothetical protein